MLENYSAEIKLLSNKKISYRLLDNTLGEINSKLPKNNKPIKQLFDFSVDALMNSIKLKNYEIVLGLSRFVFLSNFPNRFEKIKKKGVLRSSKYDYEVKVLKEIIKYLYNEKYFNEEELRYFRNVNALLKIAPDIKNEKLIIIEAIKSRKNFLKNSLAIGEMVFNNLHYDVESLFPRENLHEEFYSKNKESILESISLICQYHKEIYKEINPSELDFLDEKIDNRFYERMFFYAYKIKEFNEAEIKVDFYDYDVIFDNKNKFLLINDHFEKSKVFGYVKAKMRNFSRTKQILLEMRERLCSFEECLNELWDNTLSKEISLFEILSNPVDRIVVKTHFSLSDNVIDLFSNNNIFLEEFAKMVNVVDENYNEELLYRELYDNFTILDIIKIQRYFYYISFIYKKAYELIKGEDNEEYASLLRKRSVIPVIKDDNLYDALVRITGKEKDSCKNFIDKFTNFYQNEDEVIDLQYRPLFKSGDCYVVMPTVFAFSNLVRSFAINEEGLHLSSYDNVDYMMLDVENSLKGKGFFVEKDFEYGVDEIDIVAFKDNNLFLFECKNPYHPVNDFELRNTFDHISKAFTQLEKFKIIMSNEVKFKDFLSKLNIQFSENIKIFYGVINANRAMCGFSQNGYKVFHANELISFLNTGLITSNDKKFHCWDSDSFTVMDFISYIKGDKITNDFHDCMLVLPYYLEYRNHILGLKSFSFDTSKMRKIAKEKYREVNENLTSDSY